MAAKRGPSYPAFALGEAIERARALYEQDGRAQTSPEVAVKAWGYGSLNGASLRALSALKQYGLLEATDDYVKLSDRALAILLEDPNNPDYQEAFHGAALAPSIFATIWTEYGESLPSDGALVAYLVRKQGFGESAAQKVVQVFRKTADLAKQSIGGHIAVSSKPEPTGKEQQPTKGPVNRATSARPSPLRSDDGDGAMEFNWPLSGDAVATLTVTKRLDQYDIDTLSSYFELAKRALQKGTKAQPQDEPKPADDHDLKP